MEHAVVDVTPSMDTKEGSQAKLILVFDYRDSTKTFQEAIDGAYHDGYGLIAYPLVDHNKDDAALIDALHRSNATASDLDIVGNVPFNFDCGTPSTTFQSLYGTTSQWIEFGLDDAERSASYLQLLIHEIDWAVHLEIYYLILPPPKIRGHVVGSVDDGALSMDPHHDAKERDDDAAITECAVNYASSILTAVQKSEKLVFWIPIPLNIAGWKLWKKMSILFAENKALRPALVIQKDAASKQLVNQWYAEGAELFFLPKDVFLTNKKGFPVLSRPHQKMMSRFLRWTDCTVAVCGEPEDPQRYSQYLRHLRSKCPPLPDDVVEFRSYWDVLQTPLQPLSHNLEYATYEVFECDSVKYVQYEKAIISCLIDLDQRSVVHKEDGAGQPEEDGFIVMVLGAGRGPLVSAALRAQKSSGIKIRLFAVEKNPHAVVILREKNLTEWGGAVQIVATDMRDWKGTHKAHIVVSELLGSFGGNELSPECLDGGLGVLRPDGFSIPAAYTSYLCPITNHSVYSRLKDRPSDFETPYVVQLQRHQRLSEVQKCWSFEHPAERIMANNSHNARHCRLEFKINDKVPEDGGGSVVHGLAGYFDAVLYGDVTLSTHPQTASKGMYSWFPIYFPLIEPVEVDKGDTVTVHLWRRVSPKCVWYEWCLSSPVVSKIHNPHHRSYQVNLQ